jgi:hypothetical protein
MIGDTYPTRYWPSGVISSAFHCGNTGAGSSHAHDRMLGHCKVSRCVQQEFVPLRTIHFTQEQVREIAQVSPGEVRQWRKSVAYLAAKPGKAARFAYSDLVGLALTREFTSTLGIRISEIGPGVDALFHALANARPSHLEGLVALVERTSAWLIPAAELTSRQIVGPIIVAPCDPILVEIGARMMPLSSTSSQTSLPFPPVAVGRGQ